MDRIGVRQLHGRNVAVHRSGVPHRDVDGVIVVVGRIDIQHQVVDTVASANHAGVACSVVARRGQNLVLPHCVRHIRSAADCHCVEELVLRHHHHVDRVRTGNIHAGVCQNLGRHKCVGVAFVHINTAASHVLHNGTHDQSGFLRNVRLVQRNELGRAACSDSGKTDVRIGVGKGIHNSTSSIGVVNGDVQVNGVSVAVDLLVGAVAVQVGDGPHHRIGVNVHIGDAVAAIDSLKVEFKVTDGIAHIGGTHVLRISVRQCNSRNVAVHRSGVPHRNIDGVIIIICRINIQEQRVDTVSAIDGLQRIVMHTGSGQILVTPRIRHCIAADCDSVVEHKAGGDQYGVDDNAVTSLNGLLDLTQHIVALHVEGLVKAVSGVGTQIVHSVIQSDFIHRIDLDIQIDNAVQTMYGLHREHQGVSDGALDGGAGGILDDGVGNHVLVVVLIRKLIGAKLNGIFHKQVLRIDMHHQSVAIEHIDGMATGLADFTVDRTMLICRLIKLGGIVAVPLQDFIGVDIGTDAVPLGNHFNRHTCGSAQTDEAAGRNGIHVCGERRVTHHVVTHTRTVQKHGGGTEVAHIVNRSHCPTAVRTVVQFDCDTTHDILVLGSVHVNLEGIQCMQRTGYSGECGLGGRHNPVNNIDVDSVSAQIGSRSVDGVTPTVDGVDHRVTTDTVESEHGLQYGALKHGQRNVGHTADIQETACSRHLSDNAVLGNLHRAVRSQVGHRNTVTQDFITDGGVNIVVVTGCDIHIVHLLDGGRNCDIRIARLRSDSDNRNIRSVNDMNNQGIAGDDDGRHTLRTGVHKTNRIFTCNR